MEDTTNEIVGYASIKRYERGFDPVHCTEQATINESVDRPEKDETSHEDLVHHIDGGGAYARTYLEEKAYNNHNHHALLDAVNSSYEKLGTQEEKDIDHTIRSAPKIDKSVHDEVFKHMASAPVKDQYHLAERYSWVFHQNPSIHQQPEDQSENFLKKEHIQKYTNAGFKFVGGRAMRHEMTGTHHVIDQDGNRSIIRGTFDELHPDHAPHFDEAARNNSKYHNRNLRDLHSHYIQGLDSKADIRRYTEDSKQYNSAAAGINQGKGDPRTDATYFDKPVTNLSKIINSAPAYDHSFAVFTGMSNHSNPRDREVEGDKRQIHLPAFTSTTLDDRQSREFTTMSEDKGKQEGFNQKVGDVMKIRVPAKHKGGLFVDSHSENKGEQEYILDHGHQIKYDAEPKYFAANGNLHRLWSGEVVGKKQHKDFGLPDPKTSEHTKENLDAWTSSQLHDTHNMAAAASPNASPEHLSRAMDHKSHWVRVESAANPVAPSSIIHRGIDDMSMPVAKAAASNPSADAMVLSKGLEHPNRGVNLAAVTNPNANHGVLHQAAKHKDYEVRLESALHPNANQTHWDILSNDPNKIVANAAKKASGKLDEQIESLMSDILEMV